MCGRIATQENREIVFQVYSRAPGFIVATHRGHVEKNAMRADSRVKTCSNHRFRVLVLHMSRCKTCGSGSDNVQVWRNSVIGLGIIFPNRGSCSRPRSADRVHESFPYLSMVS
jgi:hypothetical protein